MEKELIPIKSNLKYEIKKNQLHKIYEIKNSN
jgi:hypothetical protein